LADIHAKSKNWLERRIMDKESFAFLESLLGKCGPSGFENESRDHWIRRTRKYADKVSKDVHGNAIAVLNPGADFKIMLAGHLDEIGFIVTHISDGGYLHVAAVGGIDRVTLPGSQVKVLTEKDSIDGVIGKKAIHLTEPEERRKAVAIKDVWIDIGAKNRKDAEKYVNVGDYATYAPNFMLLKNDLFSSKGCDNKTGAFVASEVLKRLARRKLNVAVYGVATSQEEIGLRGARTSAYGIDPNVGIAIDVGFASDTPGIDKRIIGEASLGKGPILYTGPNINPVLGKRLVQTAKKKRIRHQFSTDPGVTGTDAGALQVTRAGVATALVSIPNRYMHTQVETCSLTDLDNTAKLITETILTITPRTSFIP